jgi:4-alpha-glucanotransferase
MLDEEDLQLEILAEDLGHLDAGVKDLLAVSGLSGMDVWQFSADEIRALPKGVAERRACYTGTHDNNTFAGYMRRRHPSLDDLSVGVRVLEEIREIYASPAVLAMMQLQDLFLLGSEARMNVPGIPEGNWKWKIPGDTIREAFPDADERAAWFRELAVRTGRFQGNNQGNKER